MKHYQRIGAHRLLMATSCDRCRANQLVESGELGYFSLRIVGPGHYPFTEGSPTDYDLCPDCGQELSTWVRNWLQEV